MNSSREHTEREKPGVGKLWYERGVAETDRQRRWTKKEAKQRREERVIREKKLDCISVYEFINCYAY